MGPFFLSGRSLREDYLYKERGSGREKAFLHILVETLICVGLTGLVVKIM